MCQPRWNCDAYFDYVNRWVANAKEGTVGRETLQPAGYDPFGGAAEGLVEAMWHECRPTADAILAAMRSKP